MYRSQTIEERLAGLAQLWGETIGDDRVCIAVLDGPVDLTHSCFAGTRISEMQSLVAVGNVGGEAMAHGTHVASILFGGHEGPIKGIAPGCRGLIIPIFGEFQDGEPIPCSQVDLARAINLAVDSGANIVNISGGQHSPSGTAHPILGDAIRKCADAGVVIVSAAGNQGCECLHIPAALPAVLAVGAMDQAGEPMEFSNWGEAYRNGGILGPGSEIAGALIGGGVGHQTGTSYATPVVSGVIALLMSAYIKRYGVFASPYLVRDALLKSAIRCDQRSTEDCRRLLAGRLNVLGAKSILFSTGVNNVGENLVNAETSHEATNESAVSTPELVMHSASQLSSGRIRESQFVSASNAPTGLLPSGPGGGCGCGGGASAPPQQQLIYALGQLGVDFESEARRDSFAQSMGPVVNEDGKMLAPYGNPQDTRQLLAYLKKSPWDAAALTWTLSIDATPIYAILPAGPFAPAVHARLQEFLADMLEGVDRISIPGVVAGSVRLANGQIVPAIIPELRGMFSWTTDALVRSLMPVQPESLDEAGKERFALETAEVAEGVHNFLERVYYELRNLGQTPQDRAINFAATNAFNIETVFENAHKQKLDLDTIEVEPSPICRPDSDCWDVKLMFFFPEREAQSARRAYRFTVDVSDVVPVTVGEMRTWMVR